MNTPKNEIINVSHINIRGKNERIALIKTYERQGSFRKEVYQWWFVNNNLRHTQHCFYCSDNVLLENCKDHYNYELNKIIDKNLKNTHIFKGNVSRRKNLKQYQVWETFKDGETYAELWYMNTNCMHKQKCIVRFKGWLVYDKDFWQECKKLASEFEERIKKSNIS